ncbi:MAG: glycosyltransferase family 9 protein [Desulfobulbus sp.]|jgi:heptosyltransferase-2|uniref:glycosyltransferase family 9 protein n=1 Tax=Desulfobulbus sp. TaxID=895 RepID=UPI00284FE683|nr:glycosyltransferase family 9 protein [Desulfobulbus sp.]MDR2550388.1 glycosyltransferase family 9 protein [Desulfobulbus sp.]
MPSVKKILVISSWSGDYSDRFLSIATEIRSKYPGSEIHAIFYKLFVQNSKNDRDESNAYPFDKVFFSVGTSEFRRRVEFFNEYDEIYVFIKHSLIFDDNELFDELEYNKVNAKYFLRNLLSLKNFFVSGSDQKKEIIRILSENKRRNFEIRVKVFFLDKITRVILFFMGFFDKYRKKSCKYKILFIRLDVLGDMVLSLPALLALRRTYQDAEITVLASKRSGILIEEQHRLQPNKFCDHLVEWRASWHENKERLQGTGAFFYLFFEALRFYRENYDLVVQPVELGTGVVFAVFMRGRRTIASIAERLPLAYLIKNLVESVDIKPYDLYHIADLPSRCAEAAGAMDIDSCRHDLLVVSKNDKENFIQIFSEYGYFLPQKVVVINIGAGSPKRRWSVENYKLLLLHLLRDKFYFPVVMGGRGDLELWNCIASEMKENVVDFVGKTDVNQVVALLSAADLVVTPDTGIMHLAAALDKKIVALFGAGWVPFCKPLCSRYIIVKRELGCSGCGDICFQEGIPPCISGISVEMVTDAINELLYAD